MVTLIINFYYIFSASNEALRRLSKSIISPPDYRKSDSEELAKLLQANKSNLSNDDRVDEQKTSSNRRK